MMGKLFNRFKFLSSAASVTSFLCALLCAFLGTLTSCELFENDVQDYLEKYTETAAIEEHVFSVETYDDDFGNVSFSSYEDAEIEFVMRNPKKFSMIPSVEFPELDGSISRVPVEIEQIDTETVIMKMPQKFLIPADEGHDLRADVSLYEPMSGRTFDIYTVDMHCNTEPPLILNPTVLNNGGSTFVIAFEMPNDEEVAIRHKDLSQVEIDGVAYPVEVTTTEDAEGIKHAVYNFPDSHFTREWSSAYSIINSKDFVHNANAAYFNTGEPFVAQDREFTLVLRDNAGLTSSVLASTSVSKLKKPVLKDQNGSVISESGMTGIPFNEDTMTGKVTIIPPTQDHLGNTVSGATVHYRVYEATGRGLIYTSGTTTESKTIELPQNTYRVEAYATLLNYENSSTTTVKFRFINNVLFVKAGAVNGDGSEGAPYATIAEAIADINARPHHETMFSIYAEDDGATKLNEEINLTGNINTDNFTIAKKPGASSATIKSVYIASSLPSGFNLIINGMTIDGAAYNGIQKDSGIPLTISNVTINNSGSNGIEINAGSVTATNLNISSSLGNGIKLNAGSLTYTGGTISSNNGSGIYAANGANVTYNSGTITANTNNGIYLYDSTLNYHNGTISANSQYGLGIWDSSVNYYNGTISGNTEDGIYMEGGSLSYYGGSVTGNTGNGIAVDDGTLTYHNGSVTNHTNSLCAGILLGAGTGHQIKNGTFSGNACALKLLGGAAVALSGGNFTQNGTGIFLGLGTLNITGGSITANNTVGITVGSTSTINMSGNPYIQNNGPSTARKNVELEGSKNITITGALTTGCRVGVYLDDTSRIPTAIGNKNSFTTNYGSFNSSSPSNFFTSDQALAIVPEGSGSAIQAALALAGANGNASYTAYDYTFTAIPGQETYLALPDNERTIRIPFEVKRTEPDDPSNPVSLYYNVYEDKLYNDNLNQNEDPSSAAGARITLSAALYNGSIKVDDLDISYWDRDTLEVVVPGLANDDLYNVKIYMTFLGLSHESGFNYKVVTPQYEFTSTVQVLPAGTSGTAGTSATYVLFGDYPQTVVPNNSTLVIDPDVQNEAGYCLGEDGNWYVECRENRQTYMYCNYSDGTIPKVSGDNNSRYFKLEPVKWRVLSTNFDHDNNINTAGKWFLVSEKVLQKSAYWYSDQNGALVSGVRMNESMWKYSTIRASLNGLKYNNINGQEMTGYYNKGFLQKAFTAQAQNLILTTSVENTPASAQDAEGTIAPLGFGLFTDRTDDKIFLLSQREATSPEYGFDGRTVDDPARAFTATDYAIACGVPVNTTNGVGEWWLRSPATTDSTYRLSKCDIYKKANSFSVSHDKSGVLPAMCIDPQ